MGTALGCGGFGLESITHFGICPVHARILPDLGQQAHVDDVIAAFLGSGVEVINGVPAAIMQHIAVIYARPFDVLMGIGQNHADNLPNMGS